MTYALPSINEFEQYLLLEDYFDPEHNIMEEPEEPIEIFEDFGAIEQEELAFIEETLFQEEINRHHADPQFYKDCMEQAKFVANTGDSL